jgi:hypothetical protein
MRLPSHRNYRLDPGRDTLAGAAGFITGQVLHVNGGVAMF